MNEHLEQIREALDFTELKDIAFTLAHLERRTSYDDFDRSTQYCFDVMKRLGFKNVQRITHKADGVSATYDCVMPQAWSLDRKKRSYLEIVGGQFNEYDRVIADSDVHPLHAAFWCAPTPKGGITAELVNFDDIGWDNLAQAKGKWLLYAPPQGMFELCHGLYTKLVASGAAGLILSNMSTIDTMPDDLQWFNGLSKCGWYLTKGEPRLPAFSITSLRAAFLKKALQKGKVTLHGEVHSRIYDGEVYTVTGIIPGESKEELALFAHLYEPFIGDDAVGFAQLCEFGSQLIKRKVKLKRTLRLVFSMELYGFSDYVKNHGKNIVMAANFDGCAFKENKDILLRRTPFFKASFTDWTNDDFIRRGLPNSTIIPECGNLSDDTFTNDPYFRGGIPTFWFHSDCSHSHHSDGFEFTPDWKAFEEQFPVFSEALEYILCVEKLPDFSKRAADDFTAETKKILADEKLTPYEKNIYAQVEFMRESNRLASVTSFTGQKVSDKPLLTAFKAVQKELAALPKQESFTTAEYKALNMIVTAGKYGKPFSLGRIPLEERHATSIPSVLWCLLDGKRNLLECIRMANAESGARSQDKGIMKIIEDLQYVAKYGYASIKPAFTLTKQEFVDALKRLGVKKGMKLMVHSTFSSLGDVKCGPDGICDALQEAIGANGVLMMPAFTFQVYHPGKKGAVFDTRETPSKTGILSETFRKRPGVLRSFDPCHSYCAWGKDAQKYVERHHLVPTIDPEESPLALLWKEDGWCLCISCPAAVTFMHIMEDKCGGKCCGVRNEEYDSILPDGKQVKLRTWGWRQKTCKNCPATCTNEIFATLRKNGKLKETMLNDAHLFLFKLDDYAKIYAKLMKERCKNATTTRICECTVSSDWDAKKRRIKKNTTAYTGPWMPM